MKRVKKNQIVRVIILSTINNLHIVAIEEKGKTLFSYSVGCIGAKKSWRSREIIILPFIKFFGEKLQQKGFKYVFLFFKGFGIGRFLVVRIFRKIGFFIFFIGFISNIPFNGCKKRKQRRL